MPPARIQAEKKSRVIRGGRFEAENLRRGSPAFSKHGGRIMKSRMSLCLLCVALLLTGCIFRSKGLDHFFPSSGFQKGWNWEGKPKHYNPQNLYEIIDGEAELYISYGFRELASLIYYRGSPEDTFFVVDIFDMGSPLNAFGLYSGFRHPEYRFEDVGSECFVSDYGIKFYKGRYLVDIKAGEFSEACRKAVWGTAREIAGRMDAPDTPPALTQMLPAKGQAPHTLRYTQREMLNQGFLPGGLEARYAVEGGDATGFVVVFDSSSAARRGFDELRDYYAVSGGLMKVKVPGELSFAAKTPYHGVILAFLLGKTVSGVLDLEDASKGQALVRSIHDHLAGMQEGK
jgi:hypothetical protein